MFRISRAAAVTAAVGLVTSLAAACSSGTDASASGGGGNDDGKFVVGYSQSYNAEPYRAQLNLQLEHYMKQYPDMELLPIADANQNSATQVSQVQDEETDIVPSSSPGH